MSNELAELARSAGVGDAWIDSAGFRHQVDDESLRAVLESIGLPCRTASQQLQSAARLAERRRLAPAMLTTWVGSPTRLTFALPVAASFRLQYEDGAVVEGRVFEGDGGHWLPPVLHAGYHQLDVAGSRLTLAVAPLRACSLSELVPDSRRIWGLSMGGDATAAVPDFSQLATLARSAAGYGADALAVGSLHPVDSNAGGRWLDPARVDFASSLPSRSLASVDSDRVQMLREYYQRQFPRDELLLREFLRFDRDGAAALRSFGLAESLRESKVAADASDLAVAQHARKNAEAIGFHIFLQWLAGRGRAAAQAAARAAGMAVGLVADFELTGPPTNGNRPGDPALFLEGMKSADPLAPSSARRSLAYDPIALANLAYEPFIELLRANMAGIGALRIRRFDRWWRHWLQSINGAEQSGAWLDYPFEDLLRLLVLESARQRCLVIVEDADELPERLREAVDQAGLLRGSSFLRGRANAPSEPRDVESADAVVASAEPLAGVVSSSGAAGPALLRWWRADDLRARIDAGELGTLVATRELALRERERHHLLVELGIERRRGWRKPERERRDPVRAAIAHATPPGARDQRFEALVVDAVVERLGSLPSPLVLVELDDLLGTAANASLTALGTPALSRLLDSVLPRSRMNRLDDARRALPINVRAVPDDAKSA